MLLEFRDLTLLFDGTAALTRLTATLRDGVIALLGANGSGKTSVLKILAGITAPTSGAAVIDGEEVRAGAVPCAAPDRASAGSCLSRVLYPRSS